MLLFSAFSGSTAVAALADHLQHAEIAFCRVIGCWVGDCCFDLCRISSAFDRWLCSCVCSRLLVDACCIVNSQASASVKYGVRSEW